MNTRKIARLCVRSTYGHGNKDIAQDNDYILCHFTKDCRGKACVIHLLSSEKLGEGFIFNIFLHYLLFPLQVVNRCGACCCKVVANYCIVQERLYGYFLYFTNIKAVVNPFVSCHKDNCSFKLSNFHILWEILEHLIKETHITG